MTAVVNAHLHFIHNKWGQVSSENLLIYEQEVMAHQLGISFVQAPASEELLMLGRKIMAGKRK